MAANFNIEGVGKVNWGKTVTGMGGMLSLILIGEAIDERSYIAIVLLVISGGILGALSDLGHWEDGKNGR